VLLLLWEGRRKFRGAHRFRNELVSWLQQVFIGQSIFKRAATSHLPIEPAPFSRNKNACLRTLIEDEFDECRIIGKQSNRCQARNQFREAGLSGKDPMEHSTVFKNVVKHIQRARFGHEKAA